MRELNLDFMSRKNEMNAARIMKRCSDDSLHIDLSWETAQAIHELWQDTSVIEFTQVKHGFDLVQGAEHFIRDVLRIGSANYTPTDADILNLNAMGITDTTLYMSSTRRLRVFEVDSDGQSLKWLPYFDNVTTIMFCAPLVDYDQLPDGKKNRMAESLQLFESVVNDPNFHQTSVVLFLTRITDFRKKIIKVALEQFFPEYQGGMDANKAAKYILWKYMQVNRARLNIYPHLINSSDKANLRLVFATVRETILQNALKASAPR
ncbi:hypothetical protein SERLADRAFT_477167 [Serpula lacrymans var. lacrymans S7.9]|nr:uncharacterized protein SERLADRAFT_477167 [Serpula lacrymans var. lacrymans S7.9]EGO20721.1 hypothetical protein SERLADRAFT_477167 [Serpula lacrymans var. lacrymans S7.9]